MHNRQLAQQTACTTDSLHMQGAQNAVPAALHAAPQQRHTLRGLLAGETSC